MNRKLIESGSLTLFVFGLIGWIYIATVVMVHPETLELQLTHLTPWLREDTFGILSIIVSFFSFFVWRIVTITVALGGLFVFRKQNF